MKKIRLSLTIAFMSTLFCSAQSNELKTANKTKIGVFGQVAHYQANDGFLGELIPVNFIKKGIQSGCLFKGKCLQNLHSGLV